jgi:hypothetical protein
MFKKETPDRYSRFNVKYRFNQIETALIAFIGDFEKRINQIVPGTPVFVQQTGDYSYYMDKKFVESKFEDIIQRTPRVVIGIDDIQYQSDQNTNQYNKIEYKLDDEMYQVTGRRLAVQIPLNLDFVSPNYIYALEHFEVLSVFVARDNVLTYEFLGNTYECAYVHSQVSMERPQMDVSSGTRDVSVRMSFDFQCHLFVPVIDSIIPLRDTVKDYIVFGGASSSMDKSLPDKPTNIEDAYNDEEESPIIIYSK